MSERKPRLAAFLVAAAVALTCGYVLKASAGPDVSVDIAVSQPMSGPQLSGVQGFMASPEAGSFIKEHPGAGALARLDATPDNLQALGALAEQLKAGKSVPAAYEAAVSQAVAELDARASRAAQAVAEGRASAASLDAASRSFAAYRVYGRAAAAKVDAFAAAAKQARAQGHAQAVAQQLLGSLRQDAGELAQGNAGAAAGGVDAASAKAGAQVHRAASLGRASRLSTSASSKSSVDGASEGRDVLGGQAAAGASRAVSPRAKGLLARIAARVVASSAVFAPALAFARSYGYADQYGAGASEPSALAFAALWAAGLFVLGFAGNVVARLFGLALRGKTVLIFVGTAVGAFAVPSLMSALGWAVDPATNAFMMLLTLGLSAVGGLLSAITLAGPDFPAEREDEARPDRASPAPASRPSVGSTPGARPASARPSSSRQPAAVKLPSARTLNGKSLSTWLSGSDPARVTAAAGEILNRGTINEFAVAIAGILGERPSDIVLPDLRLKLINAMGERRPNAAGNNVVSQSLLRVVDNGSPDEVLAATRALLKIGDQASLDKLGALVEEEFVERYQNGNSVRADVARGVLARMEELRRSDTDPNGPAYRRLNQVLSRRADNEVAARAAALSREVYARNPRYAPSSYNRSYYDSTDDFWTAYWVSGVMGIPYPSNYGMMFYFMHQMNASQSGTMPSLWEVQRDTYQDYSNGNLGTSGSFGGGSSSNYGFPVPDAPSSGAGSSTFSGDDLAPPPADSLGSSAAASGTVVSGADRSDFGDFSAAPVGNDSGSVASSSNGSSGASAPSGSGADRSDWGGSEPSRDATREPDSRGGAAAGAAAGAVAGSSSSRDAGSSQEDTSR